MTTSDPATSAAAAIAAKVSALSMARE